MRYRILDIESIGHPDAAQWAEPVKADARLKDPAKIAADIEEKTAARDEKFGLDIDTLMMVALGWHDVGCGDPTVHLSKDEFEEREGLKMFFESMRPDTVLVTFYGRQFDIPAILRRAMYLQVQAPYINLDRYRSPHIDVWDVLTFNGALKTAHGLKFYQKRLGLPSLDKVDGKDVAALVKAGDWQAVHDHCLSDIGLTHSLANRLGLLKV